LAYPPYDLSDAELEQQRKDRKGERDTARRRKLGAKPRSIYLESSLSKAKPWEALGISKPTYYRRGLHHRETSPRQQHLSAKQRQSHRETGMQPSDSKHSTTRTCLTGQHESHRKETQ
jgi:hypothetical protein